MSHGRLVSLVAILGLLLIPDSILAQKEQEARVVRIDVGITVPVAPIWKSRSLAGSTKLELTAADGPLLRMAVYFTVEKRPSPSDALQRVAAISAPPAPQDRRFLVNGWPAVEATRIIDVPQTSQDRGK